MPEMCPKCSRPMALARDVWVCSNCGWMVTQHDADLRRLLNALETAYWEFPPNRLILRGLYWLAARLSKEGGC